MDKALNNWAIASGQDFETITKKLDIDNPIHDKFERGEIDEEQFRRYISSTIDHDLSVVDFQTGWNSIYGEEIDGVSELLTDLNTEFRLIGLTNSNKSHAYTWKNKYENILSKFEIIFSSNEINSRKPEQESYQTCINYLGLPASKLIFLDDKIENITGATSLGIESILVSSFNQMKSELIKIIANKT